VSDYATGGRIARAEFECRRAEGHGDHHNQQTEYGLHGILPYLQMLCGAQADAVDVVTVIIDRHVENVTIASSARANSFVMVYNWFLFSMRLICHARNTPAVSWETRVRCRRHVPSPKNLT
jgi:hypothetical protein